MSILASLTTAAKRIADLYVQSMNAVIGHIEHRSLVNQMEYDAAQAAQAEHKAQVQALVETLTKAPVQAFVQLPAHAYEAHLGLHDQLLHAFEVDGAYYYVHGSSKSIKALRSLLGVGERP